VFIVKGILMVGKAGVKHAMIILRAQFFLEIIVLNFEPFKLNYFV
jgi:hypothetical protein